MNFSASYPHFICNFRTFIVHDYLPSFLGLISCDSCAKELTDGFHFGECPRSRYIIHFYSLVEASFHFEMV